MRAGILERGLTVSGQRLMFQTYESNLPYVLRFMVDKNIKGGTWIEVGLCSCGSLPICDIALS